jgi:hypothetical protein
MYSNLSMTMAQEHQRDLLREAKAAKLANAAAPKRAAKSESPWFPRLSFAWTARRPMPKLAVRASGGQSAR